MHRGGYGRIFGATQRGQMRKLTNPLDFLYIRDKLEGRFRLFSSPAPVENAECGNNDEIVVWPPDSPRVVDTGGMEATAAGRLWN